MPRQPRLDAPGTLHHLIGRGIDRISIFQSASDREDFLSRLADLCREGYLVLYAWALMNNHFHLLGRTGNQLIASSMRKLLTGYVIAFNRRHKRYGHLFQNRYKSIICEDDPYLLELTRYIHLNPLRAGIVENLEELCTYPWTGHAVIMGKVERSWQDREAILGYFGRRRREAIRNYEAFIKAGVPLGKREELVGGGLIRSLGGWSQVLSLRRRGETEASDQRVLGSGAFVASILSEAGEKEKETLRFASKRGDLSSVAAVVCDEEGVRAELLLSGGRRGECVRARKIFCQLAVKRLGYSGAEVARYLGVTTSAVNRMANAEELERLEHYCKLL
jgi:putative transposase